MGGGMGGLVAVWLWYGGWGEKKNYTFERCFIHFTPLIFQPGRMYNEHV